MNKLKKNELGFSVVELILIVVVVVLLGAVGWVVYKNHNKTTTTSTATQVNAILAPQTVKPVTGVYECSQTLNYGQDGNIGNTDCSSGDINILAWKADVTSDPDVMSLGKNATLNQVVTAMCSSMGPHSTTTGPLTVGAAKLVGQYNGWSFTNSSQITNWNPSNGSCTDTN